MRAAALAGLLAEPERLRVVAALALGATGYDEVVQRTGLPVAVVGKAVRRLRQAGLVEQAGSRLSLREDLFKAAARAEQPAPEDFGAVDPADLTVLRAFFRDGRLAHFPTAAAKVDVVLRYLVSTFEPGVRYPEREVNAILTAFHSDYANLRRRLIDAGLLSRDAGVYWRSGGWVDVLADD